MRLVGRVAALAWSPVAVPADHSRAAFSARPLQLEGALVDRAWRNLHPLFGLRHVDDNAEERIWRLEVDGNALTRQRTGVTGELFAVGSQARVFGRASGGATGGYAGPRWCEDPAGGRDQHPRTARPQ